MKNDIVLYQRIYQLLKNQIECGLLPEGKSLPSRAELCREFQVSEKTVRRVLEEMLEKDQGLMYALLLYVCQRGLKDQLYLNCLNYQTIRERIAYWIVGLHNLSPVESVHMPGSQLILANMLHVSRSSLNQELKLMQKDGYFKVRGREMYELDEEKLNALL